MPTTADQGVLVPQSTWPCYLRDRLNSLRATWLTKENRAPFLYTSSSIALSMAQMLAGIVLVRWILPEELGLWQSFSLALTYAYFLLGGVNNGLSRELPYFLGGGEHDTSKALAGTAQFVTGGGSLAVLLAGGGTLLFLGTRNYDAQVLSSVAAVTVLIICNFFRNHFTVTFRSKNSFIDLSRIQILEAGLMLATLPLLYYLRYEGLLIRIVLVSGLVVWSMYRLRPIKVAPLPDWGSLKLLFTTGAPIFALDYFRNCSGTLDRVALLHFGGVQQVGYYALAATAGAAFEVIPNAVAQYVYPRMSHLYGREKNASVLWATCWKTTVVLLWITIPIAAAGWFCLPPIISMFFPKYVAATRAAQLMLIAVVASGLAVSSNALWSLKAWKSMVTCQVASAGLVAIAAFVGPRLSASPVTGVAGAIAGARFLSSAVALILTYQATRKVV